MKVSISQPLFIGFYCYGIEVGFKIRHMESCQAIWPFVCNEFLTPLKKLKNIKEKKVITLVLQQYK